MQSVLRPSYIGMDFGGTKLLLGEMDPEGNFLRTRRVPTGPMDQESACRLMENALQAFLAEPTPGFSPCAVGIGLAGHVDGETGKWLDTDRDRNQVIPLARRIQACSGLPCRVDNDVKSAARAELRFGYGRTTEHFVYINVGTGIAAGVITGGRMVRGSHANAGEVGHTSSGLCLGIPCICGRTDCVELIASGSGLDRCARLLKDRYPDSVLRIPHDSAVSAADIFALYGTDSLCTALTDNAARALANLIMNMVRFSDPDTIVLGGGIVADGFLLKQTQQYLSPHTMRYVTGGMHLTELDARLIGLTGACANAMEAAVDNRT